MGPNQLLSGIGVFEFQLSNFFKIHFSVDILKICNVDTLKNNKKFMRKNRCGWFVSFFGAPLRFFVLFWRFIILYFRWSYVTAVATVGLQNG